MSTSSTRRLTPDEFRNVIGHFASGVTVITTSADDQPFGTTASAVTSLSLEPPSLLICMSLQSSTGQAVAKAGAFAVNILGEDHGDLAMRFASKGGDKFSGVALTTGQHGQPLLADALASLVCRVTEQVEAGTHSVFIAAVEEATARPGAPLAYFRGKFGRLELDEDKIVYEEVRTKVLSPSTAVGHPLDVDELAETLQVARGPVFHALSKLTSDGLLERRPDGRFVVRAIDMDEIEDAYAARRAIELGAADLSVGRVSDDQIAELRRLMEETLPLVEGERFVDVDHWIEANAAFHEYMVGLAGCETLVTTYRRLGLTAMNARALQPDDRADPVLVEDHCRLVEAYEAGDVEAAREVINHHVDRPKALRSA
jgi:DNA-binding GntR family transcriptional regulator/flavin reductase (DIM6/NTAB) family NADH-FMN oxidoreductase RutF